MGFIKKLGIATGAGFLTAISIASIAETINDNEMDETIAHYKSFTKSCRCSANIASQVNGVDITFTNYKLYK